jgi:two-component system alkaline phosphatase synthesis response regulator PhoP
MTKILIIEDDIILNELLEINLESNGYNVLTSSSIAEAKNKLIENPSFVILDLGLPDGDGKQLISSIREKNIPILILTARNSLAEKVRGLNLGADDYMEKPFETAELIARIRAILRRSPSTIIWVEIEDVQVTLLERKVQRGDQQLLLTSKEWDLLEYFITNRGYLLSREQLLKEIWGYDYYGTTRTVDVHIQKLRQKLDVSTITTLHKQGYRLER